MEERRKHPRISALHAPDGTAPTLDGPFVLRDFGAGGFAIESRIAFTAGTCHRFTITCRSFAVSLEAMVMHSMRMMSGGQAVYMTGFAFYRPTPEQRGMLLAMLDELSAPA
jgi:hypothetical protein